MGVTFGAVFVHWLIVQSLYRIGALCPFCMVVWAVTMPVFWYVTLRNLTALADRLPGSIRQAVERVSDVHAVLLTAWFLLVTGLVLHRFWDFWVAAVPG